MIITSNFDGGNIKVISIESTNDIRLNIPKDTNSDFAQWFYFRLEGAAGYPCRMSLENASECFVPDGWKDYNTMASYDRLNWFRVSTEYDGKSLIINHTPKYNSVFYAYFTPYSYEQHLDMIHIAQLSPLCVLESIGKTTQGRNIDLLTIGTPSEEKRKIWIIARQHPGETQASWFMEGLIQRLLDEDDPVSKKLFEKAFFYLVPNMNIDGAILGNLRVNALGINFNREWESPDKKKSPEVFYVRNKMDETGVDMSLDIHGDEDLPYNFVSSIEGIPGFDERLKTLQDNFLSKWLESSPDFQTEYGYGKDEPGKANLKICTKQVGYRFNCLSLTVEMPFKDNKNLPDPVTGWSAERSVRFGESVLNPILSIVDDLR